MLRGGLHHLLGRGRGRDRGRRCGPTRSRSVDPGNGHLEEVSIALVDAGVGDVVLVHAGEAIGMVAT